VKGKSRVPDASRLASCVTVQVNKEVVEAETLIEDLIDRWLVIVRTSTLEETDKLVTEDEYSNRRSNL
jgi:hypothetical protein